jgi:acyl-CoA reductase-like NAD-dependent aldehyde dehydrogenase
MLGQDGCCWLPMYCQQTLNMSQNLPLEHEYDPVTPLRSVQKRRGAHTLNAQTGSGLLGATLTQAPWEAEFPLEKYNDDKDALAAALEYFREREKVWKQAVDDRDSMLRGIYSALAPHYEEIAEENVFETSSVLKSRRGAL